MRLPLSALIVIILIFGFLTGSIIYFYNKSRSFQTSTKSSTKPTFSAEVPSQTNQSETKISSLTSPAEPKNRLSYPANTYKVQAKESLYGVGEKMGLPWQIIKQANGLTNENLIQADYPLIIPVLSSQTDYYRVNFLINQDRAGELNRELRDKGESEWFDPIAVSKKQAIPYFGLKDNDSYRLLEADRSAGKGLVEVKDEAGRVVVVGLIQPKEKGDKKLWAVLYVERRY